MFRRSNFFPRQLFFRYVVTQTIASIVALFVGYFAGRAVIYRSAPLGLYDSELVKIYDTRFLFTLLIISLLLTAFSFWTGYRMVLPLGRILVKARSILKKEKTTPEKEDSQSEDTGEWSDLDSTLHKIGKNIEIQDRNLSREKEEFETILTSLTEAVVAIDNSGKLLFFNTKFALIFKDLFQNHTKLSEFIRNNEILDAFQSVLQNQHPISSIVRVRTSGQVYLSHYSLSVSPMRDEENNVYGALGIFHDVTELKRMEQTRIDFVANVSHELRTPLTSIKGYAQTLHHDLPQASTARKFVETIEKNADRLISLVEDLLSLSSIESGSEFQMSKISCEQISKRVISQLETQRAQKRHRIELKVEVDFVFGDEKRVEQVIYNLLENAIKYTPPLGEIHVHWFDRQGDIAFCITDNGPGIPEEHQSRVFERFYRVDNSRARDQGGTGLGLAIVKHIMQRHRGSVSFASSKPTGSKFLCIFPSS